MYLDSHFDPNLVHNSLSEQTVELLSKALKVDLILYKNLITWLLLKLENAIHKV